MPAYALEHHRLSGETAAELTGLGIPADVANDWGRLTAPLNRSVVIARDGDTVVGAALSVWRTLGRYVKIAGLWTRADAADAEQLLLERAERYAWADGAEVVKRELSAAAPTADGFDAVIVPPMGGPAPDGLAEAPGGQQRWRAPRPATTVPYVRQSSTFTCGPCSLLMALGSFGVIPEPDRELEFALWREATMVQACDPYGLALAAVRHGLAVELTVTTDRPLLLEEFEDESESEPRRFLQSQFRRDLAAAGVTAQIRGFGADAVRAVLDSGRLAILLIDEDPFDQGSCAHWIIVHGTAGDAFLIHDPWTQTDAGESWLDGYDLPVLPEGIEALCAVGDPAYSALLAVGPSS
jgi:hypothetical protein